MARAPEPEKAANHERWLVSFADFMTLLFALFVVLFANSKSESPMDMRELGKGVQQAFASYGIFLGSTGSKPPGAGGPGENTESAPVIINVQVPGVESDSGGDDGKGEGPEPLPMEGNDILPEAPGKGPDSGTGDPGNNGAADAEKDEGLENLFEELRELLDADLNNTIEVRLEKRGVVISLGEAGFFASGSDALKPDSTRIIDQIAAKLETMKNKGVTIRFEGHTDNVPLRSRPGARIRDNWELSLFRASTVLQRFQNQRGYPMKNLVMAGYGEWRPIASNDTPQGRARNRHVDIVILNETFSNLEASASAPR